MVQVGLIQIGVTDDESVADRVERTLAIAAEVAADHDMIVLPELWHVGAFAVELVPEHAEPRDGHLVTRIAALARETGTWVHGGSFAERADGDTFYNCSVVASPEGTLSFYRKIHLFGFNGGETAVMTHGEEPVVIDSPLGPTGLATCYDLRFPELFRAEQELGAVAFVMATGWPDRRASHWTALCRARAIENQAYVIGCNSAGTHAGVPMAGLSLVVDPQGEVIAEAGVGEEILSVEVDPLRVKVWRDAFPALEDRRL